MAAGTPARVKQSALQSYICSVTVFIPTTSKNIFVSMIFSGRHRDHLVFFIKATIKKSQIRLD